MHHHREPAHLPVERAALRLGRGVTAAAVVMLPALLDRNRGGIAPQGGWRAAGGTRGEEERDNEEDEEQRPRPHHRASLVDR